MTTDDEHQTIPSENPVPDTAALTSAQNSAVGAPASETGGVADCAPSHGVNPLRRLWRNLRSGMRIAFFMRTGAQRFYCGAVDLALLALADLALNLVISFLLVGGGGYFSYSALPSFYFHLPLLLLFGLLASRLLSRPVLLTLLPVALISLSVPVELLHALLERLAQTDQFLSLQDYLLAPHYYRFFSWWSAAALVFLLRLNPAASPRPRILVLLIFIVLVLFPLWYYPRGDLWVSQPQGGESGELHLTEEVLSAQERLLTQQLATLQPGRKGVTDLYFVGFAGDATQDVFLKELHAAADIFRKRFGTEGRMVLLANNPGSAATLPFARGANLERAIARVGEVMNRDEDLLFLFLTSHGSQEHELEVSNPPLELESITPEKVRTMLKKGGIRWKVVVVSACYSGGFIDPLKDEQSLIITAADATHESFGCGYGDKYTWFGEAFLEHGLRDTYSFTEAFQTAREAIGQWEEEQGETPSNPQLWLGKEMERKLAVYESQLQKPAVAPKGPPAKGKPEQK
jgi:hypothetical protein